VVNGLTAGTVTVTYSVTNSCGTTTVTQSLTVLGTPTVASITGGAASVCSGLTTVAFANATEGGTWSIQNGTGTATIDQNGVVTGGNPGTVTVRYTVNNGCFSNSATAALTISAAPNVADIAGGALSVCSGSTTPAFTNATAGGLWSILNGSGTATIDQNGVVTGGNPGSVTVQYTVNSACGNVTKTAALNVLGSLEVANITGGASTVCSGSTTPAFANATAGGTWSILNGTGTATIDQLGVVTGGTAGSVTVQYSVTGVCGTTTKSASLTVNAVPTATISYSGNPYCNSGSATVTRTGQTGGTYSASPAGLTINASTGTITLGSSAPNTYTVTYSFSSNGCANTATTSVTINAKPVVAAISGAAFVCTGQPSNYTDATPDGVWSITNLSGSASVDQNGVVTGISAGNVTLSYSVTNTCGTTTVNKAISVRPTPTATISYNGNPYCNTGTATVTRTGFAGGTYTASPAGLSITSTTGAINLAASTPNTYTVTYSFTSTNGCSNTATTSVTVTGSSPLSPIAGGALTVCPGTTTPAFTNATPGGVWSILNGTGTATIDQLGVVTGGTAGSVTVQYSVAGGCGINTATKPLTVNPTPTAAIAYTASPYCNTGSASVTRVGPSGGTYTASPAGLSLNSTNGNINLGASLGGTYTVTYTFSSGGCSNTTTASVTINTKPSVAAIAGSAFICTGQTSLYTDATPGGVWSITNGSGSATVDQNGLVAGVTAGTVTLKYAVTNSCGTTTVSKSITVRPTPTATITYNGSPYCNTGTATVTRTGAGSGTYTASPAGLSINATTGAINLAASTPNTYTVTYSFSSSNGCSNTATATVTINTCSGINTRLSNDVPVHNPKLILQSTAISVKVWPLPTESFFNLSIQSGSKESVTIKVYDITGKLVQQLKGSPLETYRFGDTYVAGTYLVEVLQGTNRVTQKILKQ
jgi:hypothetical protein